LPPVAAASRIGANGRVVQRIAVRSRARAILQGRRNHRKTLEHCCQIVFQSHVRLPLFHERRVPYLSHGPPAKAPSLAMQLRSQTRDYPRSTSFRQRWDFPGAAVLVRLPSGANSGLTPSHFPTAGNAFEPARF
jgi:hypothetical protein